MPRTSYLIAACALALICSAPGRSQDSPSLGDLARQAQKNKDKTSKPVAKVITNDDMPSTAPAISSPLTPATGPAALSSAGKPDAAGKPAAIPSPEESFAQLQSTLDKLDSVDRATLIKGILGNAPNFPGRAEYEEKLIAAKQTYISNSREVLQESRQLVDSAKGIKDLQDPNDPRVKRLAAKMQQLFQASDQNNSYFQAVIAEGKELAAQYTTR
ncbi:MAG TPA: hypothetical protein VKT71_10875 [Candidatus Acidoferrales bacterium]|nr:hypothetical protein [Candidatus Acidoferrales bacterium]